MAAVAKFGRDINHERLGKRKKLAVMNRQTEIKGKSKESER